MDFDYWKLTTVVLAALALYFGYQQFRLSREKFKLDLFEKRFKVFSGARLFLTRIFDDGDLKTLVHAWEYRAAIGEASFLFGADITDYLEEIYLRAITLHTDTKRMQPLPVGEERTRVAEQITKNTVWITDQLPELTKRFAPYMKFETWK